jgi:hypothetical protein
VAYERFEHDFLCGACIQCRTPGLGPFGRRSRSLANERYVKALARIVYYWGYPAVEASAVSGWRIRPFEPGKAREVAVRCAKGGAVF